MVISLDYDGTADQDPQAWLQFIRDFKAKGHTVHMVTMRYASEETPFLAKVQRDQLAQVFYTGRKAKREYMAEKGIRINVWIDDQPEFILYDAMRLHSQD